MKVSRVLFGGVLVCAACGASGSGDVGSKASDDTVDAGPALPNPDARPVICDEVNFAIENKPVNLMIALDMSGSMANTKYTTARNAISNVLNVYGNTLHIGFDTYPDNFVSQSCEVGGPVWFDSALGNAPAIEQWLNTHSPTLGAGDPLVRELDKFINEPNYAPNFTSSGAGYLVIVADGDDCCGEAGVYNCSADYSTQAAQRTTALLAMGIRTIPVGYTQNADPVTMNAIAANGGTQFTSYIPAADAAALEAALGTIASSVVSCEFELTELNAAMDPSEVNLYLDGQVLAFDDGCAQGTGWTWTDASFTSVRLCDAVCDALVAGDPHEVTATLGCPTNTIE